MNGSLPKDDGDLRKRLGILGQSWVAEVGVIKNIWPCKNLVSSNHYD